MSAVNELVITPEFVTNIIAVDLADETTFTTADKAKLNGIEAGAQVNTVTRVAEKTGVVELDAGDIAYDASETYASGKIGAALKSAEEKLDALDAGDIGYDGSTAYDTGTVGKELSELNRQISESITPAIEQLAEDLDGKAPVIVNTASGDIASFADGADGMPVKSLIANIEPVQDLHGQASPYPPGGGKNLLPLTDESIKTASGQTWSGDSLTFNGVTWTINKDTGGNVIGITANGTPSTNDSQISIARLDIAPGAYTFSGITDGSGTTWYTRYVARDANGAAISVDGSVFIDVYMIETTKTLPSNVSFINAYVGTKVAINNKKFKPMIRLATETDATYAPYSNICPISGHTGASVTRTGKNLFDKNAITLGYWLSTTTGLPESTSAFAISDFIPVFKNVPVFIPKTNSARRWFYDRNKTPKTYLANSDNQVYTPTEDGFLRITLDNSGQTAIDFNTYQVEFGNSATAYETFVGTTLSATFPTEAGTVYGGNLDVTTWVLTVDRASVDLGTLVMTWDANVFGGAFYSTLENANYAGNGDAICSALKTVLSGSELTQTDNAIYAKNNGQRFYLKMSKYAGSLAQLQEALSGETMVYRCFPTTYQLTESEVSGILETLYGTNNVWADTGDVSIEYPADTKLYIQQLTKPTEDDMTANANIAANKFFMIGNTLYFSTTAIAQGATIIPGTNCNVISLADALNNLNS